MSIQQKISVIIGSTRQNRFSEKPARYIVDELQKKPAILVEVIDLRDWPLPFFDEAMSPAALKGNYSNETAKKLAAKIADADGYIIVTPEYNHGYPAVLKNMLDWFYPEWSRKAVGFVGYGNAGGARAIEQLRQVVAELHMFSTRTALHIPVEVYISMMKLQAPVDPELFKPLREGMRGDRVEAFFTELLDLTATLKAWRSGTNA